MLRKINYTLNIDKILSDLVATRVDYTYTYIHTYTYIYIICIHIVVSIKYFQANCVDLVLSKYIYELQREIS